MTDLICASSDLAEVWEGLGELPAKYGQSTSIFNSWWGELLENIAYQVDIREEERGDPQMARQLALGSGQPAAQAAMEASSIKDETLPRRPLPF